MKEISRRQRFAIVSIVAFVALLGSVLSGEQKGTQKKPRHLRRLVGPTVDDDDDDKCFPRQCEDKDDEDDYLTEKKRARRRDAAVVVFFCLLVVLFGLFLNERLSELAIQRRMRSHERARFELLTMVEEATDDFETVRETNSLQSQTDEGGNILPSEPPAPAARPRPPPVQGRDLRAEISNS